MLTNKTHHVLYTGVTNDLVRRVYEHKCKLLKGFTQKYNVDRLVYYEMFYDVTDVIAREKQIKSWSRKSKVHLINRTNLQWKDLYEKICLGCHGCFAALQ